MKFGSKAGVTMLEFVVASSLMVVMTGAIVLASESTAQSGRTAQTLTDMDSQLRMVLNRVGDGLQQASLENINPVPPEGYYTSRLVFSQIESFTAGEPVYANPERVELLMDSGEYDDGVDNDGDGLIDERKIVWTQNLGMADERTVTLCTGVSDLLEGEEFNGRDDNGNGLIDEAGLSFDFENRHVTIRATIVRKNEKGFLLTRTIERTISFRFGRGTEG